MYNTFILHGVLAKKYGAIHRYTKATTRTMTDAVRMLEANFPGFKRDVKKWAFKLYRGKNKEKQIMTANDAALGYKDDTYHFVPEVRAAKSGKSILGLIIGVVLIAVAWWNPLGWSAGAYYLGALGTSLALSSAANLLTPAASTPDYSDREEANNRPSYIFKGPVNTMEQGNPVPVVYGHTFVGSTVIGASIVVEED